MSAVLVHAALWVPVALVVAVLMDLWAALLHGKVWHSWLWPLHRSHHEPRAPGQRFEANDALSVLHAPIAVALILYGCRAAEGPLRELSFGVGLGMSLFGVAYVVVHDGLVHGRLPVRFLLRSRYMRGVAKAHRVHHLPNTDGAPFGLFFGVSELARATRARRKVMRARASIGRAPRPSDPRSQPRAPA